MLYVMQVQNIFHNWCKTVPQGCPHSPENKTFQWSAASVPGYFYVSVTLSLPEVQNKGLFTNITYLDVI